MSGTATHVVSGPALNAPTRVPVRRTPPRSAGKSVLVLVPDDSRAHAPGEYSTAKMVLSFILIQNRQYVTSFSTQNGSASLTSCIGVKQDWRSGMRRIA